MARPLPRFKPGDKVRIKPECKQYEGYHDRVLTVKSYHDHYANYDKSVSSDPTGHPCFHPDSNTCMYKMEEEDVSFALYQGEIIRVKT
jgi:hypothetical protein